MLGRAIKSTALAVGVFCAWVAAPALSLEPYQPEATDFEQDVPQAKRLPARHVDHEEHKHRAHAPSRFITPPVDAPHEFDLVGIAGETRPVQIRVREDDGRWSEWVQTHSGDPVYVGGADDVQVKAAFRPKGDLHYVNVSGTSGGAASRLLNSARGAVNEAFISVASGFVAHAAPKPKLVGRGAWGANDPDGGCQPRGPAQYGEVRAATVHHTVNASSYSKREARAIVLGICRFHVYGNGWDDIGYHALVDRFGRVYVGRAGGIREPVVGAHAQGFNDQTTAIASIGTHSSTAPSRAATKALVKFLAWKLSLHGIRSATKKGPLVSGGGSLNRHPAGTTINAPRVHPHRRLGTTDCPGNALKRKILKGISRPVDRRMKRFRRR